MLVFGSNVAFAILTWNLKSAVVDNTATEVMVGVDVLTASFFALSASGAG